MSKTIELTQGKQTIVDDDDYDYLSSFKWFAHKESYTFYAYRKKNGKMLSMQNVIMNPESGLVVDHINRNGLDNCRENLRVVTRSVNSRNMKIRIDNTTGHTGVVIIQSKKWVARKKFDGRNYYIGTFETFEEACEAYDGFEINIE